MSANISSYDPYAFGIASFFAASLALFKSLDAIAAISLHSPFCIPGITFLVAIDAAPSTPHFTLPCFTARPPPLTVHFYHAAPLPPTVRRIQKHSSSLASKQLRKKLASIC